MITGEKGSLYKMVEIVTVTITEERRQSNGKSS